MRGLEMTRIGHFIGTWGNVSVRVEDGVLLTPARVDYDAMTPDDLVVVDWEGNRAGGERLPTSEMHVHRLILKDRPDMGVWGAASLAIKLLIQSLWC